MRTIVFIALLIAATNTTQAQKRFIDKGACPGESCGYGKWRTEKTTIAYARPSTKARVVGKYLAGTNVKAMTGFVSLIPRRFVVKRQYEQYKPGDVLWVYTYLGEGFFKVRSKGKWRIENLNFSPWGGSNGKRCELTDHCWGELDRVLKITWWIKVKSAQGWVGWTTHGNHFEPAVN